ncbi:MAG: hypothetical protein A2977_02885 [Alphaproteobacteria bacterium RIFCSPLOWO2_01_FULL_45_8]|nr:MAG: hypothetical protein A3K20_02635 [Alphaproteobacteria bacterium GWA1_45_9]OFW89336.1 MAG: hypothetical protein A2621_00155 [Alphaproteobacteria bacterium RIFCSPHIGHO2_01_FULL_41_14]OFW96149.1 MAG: hypothetical protein A2977_02885 [Alphaproteobacteria bacterium RIFCSPLOWO2_01_FULL_45_8]HCI48314.1 hypothetical protein [Holosporales bacterium]
MVEKRKIIKPFPEGSEQSEGSLKNKNNLRFFVDRSSETVERTLTVMYKLQQEINQLKKGLIKADNEFQDLSHFIQDDKK